MDAGVKTTRIPTYLVGPHVPQGRVRAAGGELSAALFFFNIVCASLRRQRTCGVSSSSSGL